MLQSFERSTTVSIRLQQRARIILLAFQGHNNMAIAELVGLSRVHVGKWRTRWQKSWEALIGIECGETGAELRRAIQDVLSDAPRCGAPLLFSAEQVTQNHRHRLRRPRPVPAADRLLDRPGDRGFGKAGRGSSTELTRQLLSPDAAMPKMADCRKCRSKKAATASPGLYCRTT